MGLTAENQCLLTTKEIYSIGFHSACYVTTLGTLLIPFLLKGFSNTRQYSATLGFDEMDQFEAVDESEVLNHIENISTEDIETYSDKKEIARSAQCRVASAFIIGRRLSAEIKGMSNIIQRYHHLRMLSQIQNFVFQMRNYLKEGKYISSSDKMHTDSS